MIRFTLLAVLGVALATRTAPAGQLPGTLNFRNVTSARIVSTTEEQANNEKSVEFGDFDNDNDLDVVIGNSYSDFGARINKLYRNDDGIFQEVTGAPVIAGFDVAKVTRGVFLRDYDGDGWLDIAVINGQNSNASQLFINKHPFGVFSHFDDVGGSHFPNAGNGGAANSAVSIDADQANGFDLFMGNSPNSAQNRLWLNDGAGFFIDVTGTQIPAQNEYTMDVAAADLNGDGKLDLLQSAFSNFPNRILYNDLPGTDSTGPGDFQFTPNGGQVLADPVAGENAMEPGDFNGDGFVDVYWSNVGSASADQVLQNTGNDPANKAVFVTLPIETLPASVTDIVSRKATVADLNGDGRLDVFVMKESNSNSRPTVLRNTSVGGVISFVDWTPAPAFPTGHTHKGWHAAAFDTNNDGDADILIGGWSGDHLFENVPPAQFQEDELTSGVIPNLFNQSPAAIEGFTGEDESDTFAIENLTAAAFLSVVLNGVDDYLLEILDGNDMLLATIDRGGVGTEEALQFAPAIMPSVVKVRVTTLQCANGFSIIGDCGVGILDFLELLSAWGTNPGHPADFDLDGVVGILDFLALLSNWAEPPHYVVEVLARDG